MSVHTVSDPLSEKACESRVISPPLTQHCTFLVRDQLHAEMVAPLVRAQGGTIANTTCPVDSASEVPL